MNVRRKASGAFGFQSLGKSEGTHSSCPNETDQLGDVDQTHGKNGQEGLCVQVRDWIVRLRAIAGVVLVRS